MIGRRVAGLLSWGALIPVYFLLMLLAFPAVSYVSGDYRHYLFVPREEDVARLYLYSALGMSCYLIGYLVGGAWGDQPRARAAVERFCDFAQRALATRTRLLVFVAMGIAATIWSMQFGYFGLSNRDSAEVSGFAGPIGLVSGTLLVANIFVWDKYLRGDSATQSPLLPVAVFSVCALFGFLQNSKAAMLMPVAQVVLVRSFVVGRLPIVGLTLAALLFLLLVFPLVNGFRYAVYFTLEDKTPASYVPLFFDYVLSFDWLDPASSGVPEGEGSLAFGRGIYPYLADIFARAGHQVPFLNGETYVQGLETFVPRFLYPSKPDMSVGNWTGQLFDYVLPLDTITNVSPTLMGEFYMNNGLAGLSVGMTLLGLFARFVDVAVFQARRSADWLKVVMLLKLIGLEAVVATTLLLTIKEFAVLVACLLLLFLIPLHQGRGQDWGPSGNSGR